MTSDTGSNYKHPEEELSRTTRDH